MKKLVRFLLPFPDQVKWAGKLFFSYKISLFVSFILIASNSFSQLPDANSCTSKDLELVGASLPAPPNDPCACGGTRTLMLTINNKTGSLRTSFALWGTLEVYDSKGVFKRSEPIFACAGPIPQSAITTLTSSKSITFACGESLIIKELFLAWTTSNKKETCGVLEANPTLIAPKCGTLPEIKVVAGVDADFSVTDATCVKTGSIVVSPFGGVGPYAVAVGNDSRNVATGGSTTFDLSAGTYTITITDSRNCSVDKTRTINSPAGVTAQAGEDFMKTCTTNPAGKQIGETSEEGYAYSWSPDAGLDNAKISNPRANPTSTTTYRVTKTYTMTGCSATDDVVVTVNDAAVTANAGSDFTKTCVAYLNGGTIGEAAVSGFSYSWTSVPAGFSSSTANPSVDPSVTTTYTVVKTNNATGCFDDDNVTVSVDNATVTADAGSDFIKTCSAYTSGGTIGETAVSGFSYSWSSDPEGFSSTVANPLVNPSVTTRYIVRKTKISSGCYDNDDVMVTVDNATVTADAGSDFIKTCSAYTSGGTIGEAAVSGFSYSWTSDPVGFSSTAANPSVDPSVTTTYSVVKTNDATGCFDNDEVTVTVDNAIPDAPAICVVEPSLCGPSTGSITILSPTGTEGEYAYSINNGSDYTTDRLFWDGLVAGCVTGIKVIKLGTGCESSAADCSHSDCSDDAMLKSGTIEEVVKSATIEKVVKSEISVKAYPNPFSNEVKFEVTVPEAGKGSLELINITGQKVKTIYQGHMNAGINSYEVTIPVKQATTLIYMLRVGNKQLTGKLLQISK